MFGKQMRLAVFVFSIACSLGALSAQPALTAIQDILYRADGTRYNGTVYITWNSFEAGDTSNVATQNATVNVVNGVLNVRLVPTTNASAGANYTVKYNSNGKYAFTETWAVPPSNTVLRVRDVRVSTGTVVGAPAATTQVSISDVTGLSTELSIRPSRGVAFVPSRAAVINTAGQIDGAAGNLSDCVRVDGSSGPCGGGSGIIPTFVDSEVPAGLVNGSNTTFTLNYAPSPAASLALYRNGILLKQSVDYTLSGSTITFFAASTPQTGDLLIASYRYGDPNNPLSSFTSPQVVCSSTGQASNATALLSLATCTIPANLLGPGDRIEVRFQYGHEGTSAGFGIEVHFGGATVVSRSAAANEPTISGRSDVGIYASGSQWDAQSWGSSTSFTATGGSANNDVSLPITVDFLGQMTSSTSDQVVLRSFTVVRYPAQSNP